MTEEDALYRVKWRQMIHFATPKGSSFKKKICTLCLGLSDGEKFTSLMEIHRKGLHWTICYIISAIGPFSVKILSFAVKSCLSLACGFPYRAALNNRNTVNCM